MYQLEISEDAKLDIYDAFLWYEEQREGLGLNFELSLEAGFNLVQRNPFQFEVKHNQIRVHFINKFPFGIHYFVDGQIIKCSRFFIPVAIRKTGLTECNEKFR